MHAQWDFGWLLWVVILASFTGIALLVAVAAGIRWLRTNDEFSFSDPAATIAVVIMLVAGGIGTAISLPWSGQYHRFVPQSGVVSQVGYRFLASDVQGGGTTQKYVVTFRDGRSFGCLDTRCANIQRGDRLTLMCERSFQFNAPNPGWDCNWGIDRKPDGSTIP